MNALQLFLPCAAGVEAYLTLEVLRITGLPPAAISQQRGGVAVRGSMLSVMQLNLHSRLAQRVLVLLSYTEYRSEKDLYQAACEVAWERWFGQRQSFKVEVTAQHSPLNSLNFAALKIKDAICDRFRAHKAGLRPDVDTQQPDARVYVHLSTDACWLYIDTSGEPLFKRGWRFDKGDAPLKETLAAAMIAATGWLDGEQDLAPLYDPCCGSGTIVIEAAQMACRIAAGSQRRFAFERYLNFQPDLWRTLKQEAQDAVVMPRADQKALIFASDVAHRMVDFAQRNAERAGVAQVIEFRGGDALQRMAPIQLAPGQNGVLLLNPPYGERIEAAGIAGVRHRQRPAWAGAPDAQPAQTDAHSAGAPRFGARELPQLAGTGEFFSQLASHWKKNYCGWSAWVLSPDLKLPTKMRLQASRRVPLWNGPIECRLLRFDIQAGSLRSNKNSAAAPS